MCIRDRDDLRWVANCALFAAVVMMFAGVIFAGFLGEESRTYVKIASLFVSGIFGGFGIVIHMRVKKKISDTTIIKLGRWK